VRAGEQGHCDPETLHRFVTCELGQEALDRVLGHIQECAPCEEEVSRLIESGVKPYWAEPATAEDERDNDFGAGINEVPVRSPDSEAPAGLTSAKAPKKISRKIRNLLLGRMLGRGGMGAVYEAHDTVTGRRVAVKVVTGGEIDQEQTSRLLNEARAMARLSHPNILPVYDVVFDDLQPILVMEYIDGVTLDRWQRRGSIDPRLAARIVRKMALAVDYAHQQGVVHRDLKPSNVMLVIDAQAKDTVDRAGDIDLKITDFGIAKILDPLATGITRTGELIGTPQYMSPEQAMGNADRISTPTDVYSLGTILYELLVGKPPFVSSDPVITLQMVRDTEPLPPKSLRPDVPVDLDTICMKCLEKSAERRYASAAELAEELTEFLENRPIRARPIGHIARMVRWGKRNRTVAVAWSAIIALLATLVVIGFVVAKRERDAFRVQTVLLIEANAAKEKLRQAWKTTLDQTGHSLSAMTTKYFKLGIPLKDLPSEERQAFEGWAKLVSDYLKQMRAVDDWTMMEAHTLTTLLILEEQLDNGPHLDDQTMPLIERAERTLRTLQADNDPSDDEDAASLLLALGTMKRNYRAQPVMGSGAASP
jgi:tRNA A-37 threonylcarbamoyl transferase component Bud32